MKNLQRQLVFINNRYLLKGVFFTLLSIFMCNYNMLVGLGALVLSFAYLFKILNDKKKIMDYNFQSLSKEQYQQKIVSWFLDYIENSHSLKEKQYKLVWFKLSYGITNILLLENPIKSIFSNNKNYSSFVNIQDFNNFNSYAFFKKLCSEMLNEDDDILIKSVYQDFAECGLFVNYLSSFNSEEFKLIAKLQNHTLTEKDKILLKTISFNKIEKSNFNNFMHLRNMYEDKRGILEVINNESELENLALYRHFFSKLFDGIIDDKIRLNVKNDINAIIDKKIAYLSLNKILPDEKDKSATVSKIVSKI